MLGTPGLSSMHGERLYCIMAVSLARHKMRMHTNQARVFLMVFEGVSKGLLLVMRC